MQRIATSPWAVLGLDEGASLDEVLHAFRVEAKRTHPDHGGDRAAFEAVRTAFEAVRPLSCRRANPPAWPGRNPYAWSDQPLPPAPSPRFQPPRQPHPRPRPRVDRGQAFAQVLESVLAAA